MRLMGEAAQYSGYTLSQILGQIPGPAPGQNGADTDHFILVFALVLATLCALWAALEADRETGDFGQFDGGPRQRLSERSRSEFPEALDLMRRGLRDGRNAAEAMMAVAYGMPGPLGNEFALIAEAAQRGRPLDLVLRGAARRHDAPEFVLLGVAVDLARQRNGDLGPMLEVLAQRLRQARQVRLRSQWLGARARAAALVMAVCPLALAVLLFALDHQALVALVTTRIGLVCLGTASAALVIGIVALVREGRPMP